MIEIIPAIDLIDGKCVRLSQGDFAQKTVYNENPLETALKFAGANIKRLHIVDLDGAKSGKIKNLKILEKIAAKTDLIIDFGGGVKNVEDIESVFNAGAAMVNLGSVAVKNAAKVQEWLEKYGGEKILLGADVRGEKISINGWKTQTELSILPFLLGYSEKGLTQAFVTDINKDGLLKGVSTNLYQKIIDKIPDLKLIASGGVSSTADISELEKIGCAGVIVGKAFYEGKISLTDLAYVGEKNNSVSRR